MFNSTTSIAYSKKEDKRPPTTIKLEDEPCMDSFMQSSSFGARFYGPELQNSSGCKIEKFNGIKHDPRYIQGGFETNELEVQDENGVLDILMRQRHFSTYVPRVTTKETYKYLMWTRPTIGWSLACEYDGLSRKAGKEAFETSLQTRGFENGLEPLASTMIWLPALMSVIGMCICTDNRSDYSSGALVFMGLICSYLVIFIMLTIALTRLALLKNDIGDNMGKLHKFDILQVCADDYSKVNTTRVRNELTDAEEIAKVFFNWGLALMSVICSVVILPVMFMIVEWAIGAYRHRRYRLIDDDDYYFTEELK